MSTAFDPLRPGRTTAFGPRLEPSRNHPLKFDRMRHFGLDPRLFWSLTIGVFMGALDLTIVAPAIPQIGAGLDVSPSAVVLAFSIYAAFYAVSVPVMSKLADVKGYGNIYRLSLLLFAAGSALAAASPSVAVLVAARVVQGIGGGGLFPVAQAIVGTSLKDREQGSMLAILVGVFALGGVLGPNIGGFFAQALSWRWIFWINVPLGVIGALVIRGVSVPSVTSSRRVDWAGALLIAITLGGLVFWLESLRHADRGLFSPLSLLLLGLTVGGAVLFVVVERTRRDPIIDISFLRSREIVPLLVVSLLTGYALLGGVVFAPLYAQIAFGATSLASGAMLNAAAVGLGVSSYLAGRFSREDVSGRLILGGSILTAVGIGGMIILQDYVWGIMVGLVFLGMGLGLTQGPLSHVALRVSPGNKQGEVSGLVAITRSIGGAAGITLAGVWLSRNVQQLTGSNSPIEISPSEMWSAEGGIGAVEQLPSAAAETVQRALVEGLVEGWYWALGAAVLSILAALLVNDRRNGAAKDQPDLV